MIALIAAYAHNRVLGRDNQIPWHLPSDLKFFREVTTGHTVVMGRNTFESMGKPLPNRRNVVLTRDTGFHPDGVDVAHSKLDALAMGDLFVIGGARVYAQFLDDADMLYITEIDADIPGDVFFPEWDREQFEKVSEQQGTVNEKNLLPHKFVIYRRTR